VVTKSAPLDKITPNASSYKKYIEENSHKHVTSFISNSGNILVIPVPTINPETKKPITDFGSLAQLVEEEVTFGRSRY